jgi:hypothetical protein
LRGGAVGLKDAALLRSAEPSFEEHASPGFRRTTRSASAKYGQGWIRTSEGVKPADLQSAPFGRFGTYP